MTTPPDGGLTAALFKITEHAERLGQLETRVAANLDECQMATAGPGGAVTDLRTLAGEQGRLIESLSQLVAGLVPPAGDDASPGYKPRPSFPWWTAKPEERQKAVDRLAAWVEQVYRPWYGHLAAGLGRCWQQHPLCLVGLEMLAELHSVLHLQPERTAALLSAQAEFQTRMLPAFGEQFRAECSRCTHRDPPANGSPWRGAR